MNATKSNRRLSHVEQVEQLFRLCDAENKGYISKDNLEQLGATFGGLSDDQMEAIFDQLDSDQNGQLTLEEFSIGFGGFIAANQANDDYNESDEDLAHDHPNYDDGNETDDSNEFESIIENLGANELFADDKTLRRLWEKLRKDSPELQTSLEDFIYRVSKEIKRTRTDFNSLETTLSSRTNAQEEELKKLYDDMERQLKSENDKRLEQEKLKEQERRDQLQKELEHKEQLLNDTIRQKKNIEELLERTNENENETLEDNEKLLRTRLRLENELERTKKNLDESRDYIVQLQTQSKSEKKNRAKQALRFSETLAQERESLIQQLELLKGANKKLQDEKDEMVQKQNAMSEEHLRLQETISDLQDTHRKIVMNELTQLEKESDAAADTTRQRLAENNAAILASNELIQSLNQELNNANQKNPLMKQGSLLSSYFSSGKRYSTDIEEEDEFYGYADSSALEKSFQIRRDSDVESNETMKDAADLQAVMNVTPERVFKVVFVGDSNVGKSSFIGRFCSGEFLNQLRATISFDFQVKTKQIDNKYIAIQLWDTAGHERYKAFTKQYYRRADGVIIMYDVTSEQSFMNTRDWLTSVVEVQDWTVVCLVGNKIDLVDTDDVLNGSTRRISYKQGAQLADQFGCLFYESSAKTNENIDEIMEALGRLLCDKELEKTRDDAITLTAFKKQKKCCMK
ncbi:hypothetical protein SNEBB_005898 [Seison nebaliae]|nr:hypothetical protein SNEBB_005898 [Seison nebaliae]